METTKYSLSSITLSLIIGTIKLALAPLAGIVIVPELAALKSVPFSAVNGVILQSISIGFSDLDVPKSNWANTLDEGPFEAYQITCGITFTFGGVRIDSKAQVQNTDYQSIEGLFAAGEMVGGIFYFNYPGGSGLINGAVFGKIAGEAAGKHAVGQHRAAAE